MSEQIDTAEIRKRIELDGEQDYEPGVLSMCNEIERLRKELENERLVTRSNDIHIKDLQDEIDDLRIEEARLQNEIDRLKWELRRACAGEKTTNFTNWPAPRSIKDDPPQAGATVIAYNGTAWHSHQYNEETRRWHEWTHWLPMPPTPQKVDAFEEWADAHLTEHDKAFVTVEGYTITRDAARAMWNAAMKSKENEQTR